MLNGSIQTSSPASGPLACYIPPLQPGNSKKKTTAFHAFISSPSCLPPSFLQTQHVEAASPLTSASLGPDLVFGGRVVQRVQLPAQLVHLVVDVVHLSAETLVLPQVAVKLPLVLVSLGIRPDLWVNTGGGGRQGVILGP